VFCLPIGYILIKNYLTGVIVLNLYEFWRKLNEEEKSIFCEKVGISYSYMESHLIHGRKNPRMRTVQAIVDASDKQLTHQSLFNFFLKKERITQKDSNHPKEHLSKLEEINLTKN